VLWVSTTEMRFKGQEMFLSIYRDITERKRAQDELKVADEKLRESFQQIQNQKNELERKSRNLEETNRHLDGFAYSVSHDLRAPLRAISGFSQVLLDEYKGKVDDQMKHYLERIFKGTQKMGDLIDALLHFSRTTRAELQYETVDVEKIITNIIKDKTAAHPERTIDFVVQPLPMVEADGKMVEVIFRNLIENAVKFTGKQKNAHIEIGSRQDKNEQQFFVKDNGAGFDMKFKDKLFVAFQRLHSENEFEGNGIGLTTVARLVTKHDGRVWAEGEVDKGATFYFTLPLKTSNL
ncbi:MAG: ATP-binding protein, partial [Euryarchaeota archaeon]|nr:ATP-binding protein [Euryarchaeota archaeon]